MLPSRPAVADPEYVGANEGASGAALLLELARVIAEKPLPYTTWIVFLDGEAPSARTDARAWSAVRALARRRLRLQSCSYRGPRCLQWPPGVCQKAQGQAER